MTLFKSKDVLHSKRFELSESVLMFRKGLMKFHISVFYNFHFYAALLKADFNKLLQACKRLVNLKVGVNFC